MSNEEKNNLTEYELAQEKELWIWCLLCHLYNSASNTATKIKNKVMQRLIQRTK